MRIDLIATLLGAGLLGFQGPLGTVRQVAIESNDSGTVAFRVTGANPCGAVHFVYGDGNAVTHPIVDLPTTITYRYSKTGDYTVTVSGMGNCQGETQTRVRATVPVRGPQAEAEAQTTGRGRGAVTGRARGRGNQAEIRFAGMDRDADRVITRDEWTGSVASFRIHDWNRDGVLSGAEIQMGATRPEDAAVGSATDRNGVPTWSRAVFQRLDTNDDGRIALGEWRYEAEAFRRADRNGDRFITAEEFLATDVDDDRDDRFEYLDTNNDGFLSGTEWHGSAATFDWLDQNRDRRLSRLEAVGEGGVSDPRGGGAAGPTTRLQVRGDTPWIDTGLTVRLGEELIVRATGEVQLSARADDRADAEGSRLGRVNPRAPLPRELAGALIARVDRSEPFVVSQPGNIIRVGQAGRLYLGINDENFADNRGQLEVTITRTNGNNR